ncbi:LLM class flavin-dependent oxidoreductase [Microbacterium sp. BWT-B31]|uniref:LLM class flavin-dependent oxidoreductase n=1 Tax=Microbacterium sp. BWT-B31 TaxID=3232072 RepID=UPI0035289DBA
MTRSDQMILVTNVYPVGGHIGGWRDPSAFNRIVMNLDAMTQIARLAERGKFHSLFLADGNAVRQMEKRELFENVTPTDRPASFEPTTAMAAIAQHTEHIGMFVTATTTYEEPYSLARRLSSLDHISRGRAIWNVVTTSYPGDAANFGSAAFPERDDRYRRANEFIEVCKALWDSWAADAFPQDKATGRFLDADRVRRIDHHGEFFDVQGPLNVGRSPQGHPVLFMAGQSEPGRDLAARHAECLFASARTKEQSEELAVDVRSRMAAYGRLPTDIKIIPGVSVNVAETKEDARELNKHLASLVSPELGFQYLSSYLHADLTGLDPDGPLPDLTGDIAGVRSIRDQLYNEAVGRGLSIRQTWTKLIAGTGDEPFTGTAGEVADQLQEWFESGACDGFMLGVPTLPRGLERVVDLLIPELQRRSLFHEEYTGGTLREELRLRAPASRFVDVDEAPAPADTVYAS